MAPRMIAPVRPSSKPLAQQFVGGRYSGEMPYFAEEYMAALRPQPIGQQRMQAEQHAEEPRRDRRCREHDAALRRMASASRAEQNGAEHE